jgi:serpin B
MRAHATGEYDHLFAPDEAESRLALLKALVASRFSLEALMTNSMLGRTGVRALFALLSIAIASCSSDSEGPAPDAAARDAFLPPDVAADTVPDSVEVADTTPDSVEVADTARAAVEVADTVPAAVDVAIAVDAALPPDFGSASSSIQRIADPQVPSADSTTLASDNAAFAFAAYNQLIAKNTNLVFSPASISIALAMTYAGAAGTTASEMAQALHFTLPPARLHPAFNALDLALASRGEGKLGGDGGPMRLRIVNALWAEQTYTFKSDFLATLAANYGADVNLLDFVHAPDPSRLTINAWVADQTENKIQDLLPPDVIDKSVKLVLTDAVYFNAAWKTPFNPGETYDRSFNLLDGSWVMTKLMTAEPINLPAVQGTNFKAVSLPYADDRLALVVVVPDAGQFTQVESSLDATALATLVAGMTSKKVSLGLPRFRIETGTSLVDLLKALGMTSAFDPAIADFSGMDGTGGLFISEVIHKAFIDVAEKGTEAAAATAVVMKDASAPMVDMEIWANKPFLYFLRDQPTGSILFMGRVLDPSKN